VEANSVAKLLIQSTEEMTSVVAGLNGGYIKPAPGGGKFIIPSLQCINSFFFLMTATHEI
jgi:cobalamin biosynthesis Mg chelatase CobN